MFGKVIAAGEGSLLERELTDKITRIRATDAVVRIDILTGSNRLGEYLRRRISEESPVLFNIDFMTFPDLLKKVTEKKTPHSSDPLPPFAGEIIIERMASSGVLPRYLEKTSATRGFAAAILRTFTSFAEAGLSGPGAVRICADPGLKKKLPRIAALLPAYAEYRKMIDDAGGDIHSEFIDSVEVINLEGYDVPFIAYGFYDFNEEQWKVLSAIAMKRETTLFVPFGDGKEYRFARRLIDRATGDGFELSMLSSANKRVLPSAEILSVRDDEDEYREIARRALLLAGEEAVRFEEMAVIALPETDRNLLVDIFKEARIPCTLSGRVEMKYDPAARGALKLTGLLAGEVRRADLVEFLSAAPLDLSSCGAGAADPVSLWIRKSAEAGMTGERGWGVENTELLERLIREEKRGVGKPGSVSSVRFVGGLLEKISLASRRFSASSSWSDHSSRLSALVSELFDDSESVEALKGLVESLAGLDRISGAVSYKLFLRVFTEAVDSALVKRERVREEGISVLTPVEARGLRFRVIFIPSMTQSSLPGRIRQDPFLKDGERRVIGQIATPDAFFPEKGERYEEQVLLFNLIIESASELVVCSRPRVEGRSGRERAGSSFIRFVKEKFSGGSSGGQCVEKRISGRMRTTEEVEPVSEREFDIILVASEGVKGAEGLSNRFFKRGLMLSKARWQNDRLTPYDAVFSSKRAREESKRILDEKKWSFSATSLESWARCPFSYFLEKMLGVESVSEPERILTIDRLERGRLVHSLLEDVFRRLGEKKYLPLSGNNIAPALDTARGSIDQALARYEDSRPVGLPVFWDMEKDWMIRSVTRYLEHEARRSDGLVPCRYEASFGGDDSEKVSFRTGKGEIFFHGRIDRIDSGGGGRFRVIDYKTGNLKGTDDDIQGGTSLQLPVYLQAASKLLVSPVEQGVAWYQQITPEARGVVRFSGEDWNEKAPGFSKAVDLITDGIEKGYFFIYPDSQRCRFCGLKEACLSSREKLFRRKSEHDRLSLDFIALRGNPGSEEN
ncbi:MAG: PD-(D/E)XK nuclease family protein [Candidatus Krumholzibacteriota bacterium]|nr:PD-(D/E)XK nuclease family protein [Candidatus Krumholzibacteriota bacterium]